MKRFSEVNFELELYVWDTEVVQRKKFVCPGSDDLPEGEGISLPLSDLSISDGYYLLLLRIMSGGMRNGIGEREKKCIKFAYCKTNGRSFRPKG